MKEYNKLTNGKEDYRQNYYKTIIALIENCLQDDVEIIAFPEYTIPGKIFKKITAAMESNKFKKDFILIAGSHLDKNSYNYNVSPIVIYERGNNIKIFRTYKIGRGSVEKLLESIRSGKGHLIFENKEWIHFGINICIDAHTVVNSIINKVDVLFVPSFDHKKLIFTDLENRAKEYKRVIVYTNTYNEKDNAPTTIFVPLAQGKRHTSQGVNQTHRVTWQGTEDDTKEDIFSFYPAENKIEQFRGTKGTPFFYKQRLIFNPSILDVRRKSTV